MASRGERHPDPVVSTVAFEWASWQLDHFREHVIRQSIVAGLALLVALAYLANGHLTIWFLFVPLPGLLLPRYRRHAEDLREANGFRSA